MNINESKILITGGKGFLGSSIIENLSQKQIPTYSIPQHWTYQDKPGAYIFSSKQYDITKETNVARLFEYSKPDIVIHLAARVGGIGINSKKPGTFYYQNAMMGTLMIEYSRIHAVKKFVAVSTICAYPKHTPTPFKETDLWNGYPEETNAPYGIAKRALHTQLLAYRNEFGFNGIYLLPVNLYGPGDNFDDNSSHVIPAIINKIYHAKENNLKSITCWGDGTPTREFIYVTDAAKAIVDATILYDKPDPVNIGTGIEISIKELVSTIKNIMDYNGTIIWDTSQPNGQPRRCLDVSKSKNEFGFTSRIPLIAGLEQTIQWYLKNKTKQTTIN